MHSCERTVQRQQHQLSVTGFAQSRSPNAPISGEPLWGIALKRQLVGTAINILLMLCTRPFLRQQVNGWTSRCLSTTQKRVSTLVAPMLALSFKTWGLNGIWQHAKCETGWFFFFLFLLAATCMTSTNSSSGGSSYKYSGKPAGLDATACEARVPTILQAALCTASARLQWLA